MDITDMLMDDDDFLSDDDFLDDDVEEDEEEEVDEEMENESGEESIDDIMEDLDEDLQSTISDYQLEDSKCQTVLRLTKYERANIIGLRATQIQAGSTPFINVKNLREITPIQIAEEELKQNKLNFFKIKRTLPSGKHEIISLKHLKY